MKLKIKTIPNAKQNRVVEENGEGEGRLKVYVTAPAAAGKANKAVIALLAKHFRVRKSQIVILKGEKTRRKVVAVQLQTPGVV